MLRLLLAVAGACRRDVVVSENQGLQCIVDLSPVRTPTNMIPQIMETAMYQPLSLSHIPILNLPSTYIPTKHGTASWPAVGLPLGNCWPHRRVVGDKIKLLLAPACHVTGSVQLRSSLAQKVDLSVLVD